MSEKYRVGIEVKSVDYYTLEVELVECNDIESVSDELERDGIHPDDITYFLSEKKLDNLLINYFKLLRVYEEKENEKVIYITTYEGEN